MSFKMLLSALLLLSSMSTLAQKYISLNGKWQFQTDSANIGETQQWYREQGPVFTDELRVPGNWNTENRYTSYTGSGWYRKTVFISSALKGKLIRLYFEGVYNKAKVWVNGKFLMDNDLGYLQFEKDVSALLRYGKNNTIVVCAENHFKPGATWNWGGIRRPVKFLINDPVYIPRKHVTPLVDLSKRAARIIFEVSVHNTSRKDARATGKVEIFRKDTLLKTVSFGRVIKANAVDILRVEAGISPNQFWLWELDDPNLYQYKITLYNGQRIVDESDGHFGLRVLELDKTKKQLRLNGKVIRPIGFNLVPDDRTNGNALPLWRVKEDVDIMKSLGARLARLSHVPFHEELLDYLDEKGILIFEEIPVWGDNNKMVKGNNPITDQWLTRMINDHYNHPCIAGWSVANEIGKNKDAMTFTDNAIRLVKGLDSTRFGVTVSYTATNPVDPLQLSDIGFLNGYGRAIHTKVDRVHTMHPESTLFLSEFGLSQLNEDLATDFPIQNLMDSLTMKPYLIGAALWTFNDYRSTFKDTKEASQNRPWGLVDVNRQKKKAFFSFQKTNKPVASFRIAAIRRDHSSSTVQASVYIKPRSIFDLPSYELNNYRVVLKLIDKSGNLAGGDFVPLPLIKPGDDSLNVILTSKTSKIVPLKASVSLVSPQNYVLYDTVVFFQKPSYTKILYAGIGMKPLIIGAKTQKVLQIRFEKNGSAVGYKLKYSIDGQQHETPVTTADHIDILNFNDSRFTNLELIAINNVGETGTALPDIKDSENLLPPLIRFTEAADSGYFIGFETGADDVGLVVETTERSGEYRHARAITVQIKGTVKISGLANGKMYYYHLKRINTSGLESDWSEEIAVTPDGYVPLIPPCINGVIKKASEVIVCFEPIKKAVGYELQYRFSNEKTWRSQVITSSQIDQFRFKHAGSERKIEIRLGSINERGKSVFSDIFRE